MKAGTLEIEILSNLARLSSDMNAAKNSVSGAMSSIERSVAGAKRMLAGLGIGFGLNQLAQVYKDSIMQAEEAQQVQLRLNAVYKATGGVVGFTTGELHKMADAMAATTQFDDEAIRNGMAELIKFGNVTGKVFTDSLNVIKDYAAFSKQEFASAAADVGKALADTEHAAKLLKTAGVILTDQQKELIKALNAAGKEAEAQRIVLDLLEKTYGGTSDTMNTGITKSTRELGKAWDELLESFGKSQSTGGVIGGFLDTITSGLKNIKGMIDDGQVMKLLAMLNPAGAAGISIADMLNPKPKEGASQSGQIKNAQGLTPAQVREQHAAAVRQLAAIEATAAKKREEEAKKSLEIRKKYASEAAAIQKAEREQSLRELQNMIDIETDLLDEQNAKKIQAAKELSDAQWQRIEDAQNAAREEADEAARLFDIKVKYDEELQREKEDLNVALITNDKERVKAQLALEHQRAMERIDLIVAEESEIEALRAQENENYELRMKQQIKTGVDGYDELLRAVKGFGKEATEALVDFAFGGKTSFGDMVTSMLKDLARLKIQRGIIDPIIESFDIGGLFGDIFGTSGYFGMGSYASGTNYVPRDMIAQIHKGERIIPAGQNDSGNGGNTTVHVSVDATGSKVQGNNNQANELGNAIGMAVRAEIVKQKGPGGLLF